MNTIIPIFTDGHINRRSWNLLHEKLDKKTADESMQNWNARIQAEVLRSGESNIPPGYDDEGNPRI